MAEFLELEAEVVPESDEADEQDTGIDTLSQLFDNDGGDSFISDGEYDPGQDQHRDLLNKKLSKDDQGITQAVLKLVTAQKRACPSTPIKPKRPPQPGGIETLSPQLQALQLSNGSLGDGGVRKRITFGPSEHPGSPAQGREVGNSFIDNAKSDSFFQNCAKVSNSRAAHLAKFKEEYRVSFTEVTRPFKSDKTQNQQWVISVLYCHGDAQDLLLALFKKQCINMLYSYSTESIVLYCDFAAAKNRDGIRNILKAADFDPAYMLCEPPNIRNPLCGMFWKKFNVAIGEFPEWIINVTTVGYKSETETFELTQMVQWALDHQYTDESIIAYKYAQIAMENRNAELWLASNSQAKYLRDCCTMVRNYRRAQMQEMSMSAYIASRAPHYEIGDDRGYKKICKLLGYQGIIYMDFLLHLKALLHRKPKKSALAIVGVPDSGKSMLCMSLIKYLAGNVLSFSNMNSHFWLQPLADCKIALIDDATEPCWSYIDTYLRTALDGSPICIDMKHRAPMQIRCPPLLITSNINISSPSPSESKYPYLLNRIAIVSFTKQIPVRHGTPVFTVEEADWKSFFNHFWLTLELDPEVAPDGCNIGAAGDSAGKDS
ncbi:E1 [Anas platyrhynchos papillomavirus 2]|nr:E1 [Anas platyrhynchos papillomavirus 2]